MSKSQDHYDWPTSKISSATDFLQILEILRVEKWLCRGQSKCFGELLPKIDRTPLDTMPDRASKIRIERQSIELFRSMVRFFASEDEKKALHSDISTLMLLQHYGIPTRLLDWTLSPFIAAYFSVCQHDDEDSELWCFDYDRYIEKGNEQWQNYPGVSPNVPVEVRYAQALSPTEPEPDFFMCVFYYLDFHRMTAQDGAFSMTAKFGQDHAHSLFKLLDGNNYHHRYVIRSRIKPKIRRILQTRYGIWGGSLFPDTAGSAETVKEIMFENAQRTILKSSAKPKEPI